MNTKSSRFICSLLCACLLLSIASTSLVAGAASGVGSIISNPDFESNADGWAVIEPTQWPDVGRIATPAGGPEGFYSAKIAKYSNGDQKGLISEEFPFTAGESYELTYWTYGYSEVVVGLYDNASLVDYYYPGISGGIKGQWTKLYGTIKMPDTGVGAIDAFDIRILNITEYTNLLADSELWTFADDYLGKAGGFTGDETDFTAFDVASGGGVKTAPLIDLDISVEDHDGLTSYTFAADAIGSKVTVYVALFDVDGGYLDHWLDVAFGGNAGGWTPLSFTFPVNPVIKKISVEFRHCNDDAETINIKNVSIIDVNEDLSIYVDDIDLRVYIPPVGPRVGAFYFNNWTNAEAWSSIAHYEGTSGETIEPIAGYYRDAEALTQEFHINQATQHGINFWMFDLYYDIASDTVLGSNAALDQGFLNASNRNLMEFAVIWCNEDEGWNDATDFYPEAQLRAMVGTLHAKYFSQPNYLKTVDNRPIFAVTKPERFKNNDGVAILKDEADKMGFDLFVMTVTEPRNTHINNAISWGFDAFTMYSYRPGGDDEPYRAIIDDYKTMWDYALGRGDIGVVPMVSPGWDSRPWVGIGDRDEYVFTGASPSVFGEMCDEFIKYIDPDLNMLMVGTWNEFGEGTYIEPTVEHGCDYLDALAEALGRDTSHTVLTLSAEDYAWITFKGIPPLDYTLPPNGNLVKNPGFEDDYGWVTFNETSFRTVSGPGAYEGRSVIVTKAQSGIKTIGSVEVEANASYEISIWAYGRVHIVSVLRDAGFIPLADPYLYHVIDGGRTGQWFELRFNYKPQAGVGFFDLEIVNAETAADIYLDNVVIRIAAENPITNPGNGTSQITPEQKPDEKPDEDIVTVSVEDIVSLIEQGEPLYLETPVGSVMFDLPALVRMSESGGEISVEMKAVDVSKLDMELQKLIGGQPVYEFTLTVEGESLSYIGGKATMTVPYEATGDQIHPEALVLCKINEDGQIEIVARSQYSTDGSVSTVINATGQYVIIYNYHEFEDSIPSWAQSGVTYMAARDLLIGIDDDLFEPDKELTRGVFAANILKAFGIPQLTDLSDNFPDVEEDSIYAGYIAAGKALGILKGSDGLFYPESKITRKEMFVLIYNILEELGEMPDDIGAGSLVDFEDAYAVAPWAYDAIDSLISTGIIRGSDGRIYPDLYATNAHMATIIYNLFCGYDDPGVTENLLKNSGFEASGGWLTFLDQYTVSGSGEPIYNGKHSFKLGKDHNGVKSLERFEFTPGAEFSISFYTFGKAMLVLGLYAQDGSFLDYEYTDCSGGSQGVWTEISSVLSLPNRDDIGFFDIQILNTEESYDNIINKLNFVDLYGEPLGVDAVLKHSDDQSFRIAAGNGAKSVSVSVDQGQTYTISAWVYGGNVDIHVAHCDANGIPTGDYFYSVASGGVVGRWTLLSAIIKIEDPGIAAVIIDIRHAQPGGGPINVDDVSMTCANTVFIDDVTLIPVVYDADANIDVSVDVDADVEP